MHVPDHFLNDPTSATTAVLAVAGVVSATVAAQRDARTGRTRATPVTLAATTALVFGSQMLNYPVASGTSGHLLGGALAAALLGPAWGVLSVSTVLLIQCLIFADGGPSALGTNVFLMALVGTLVGWWVQHGVARALTARGRPGSARVAAIATASAAGAFVSVVAAALVFTLLFVFGGTVAVSVGALASQMLGVHALIGLGEAVITAALVAVIALVAPGWCAADSRPAVAGLTAAALRRRAAGALGATAAIAVGLLAPVASGLPDGLEATAVSVGFAGAARDHAMAEFPLAGYGAGAGLSIQVVGLIGLAVCAGLAFGVGRVVAIGRVAPPATVGV
ncbi:MAG: energy-coupling factor ABC transporter permease [Bifidobacteriaceae bacterium]|jgi:cobalt/nickel transport system permease protein|nr:energy-coupling factor ABC transporter permease [Bifidobacteriaceae bacterium]